MNLDICLKLSKYLGPFSIEVLIGRNVWSNGKFGLKMKGKSTLSYEPTDTHWHCHSLGKVLDWNKLWCLTCISNLGARYIHLNSGLPWIQGNTGSALGSSAPVANFECWVKKSRTSRNGREMFIKANIQKNSETVSWETKPKGCSAVQCVVASGKYKLKW